MAMLSIPSYKTDDPNYRYKMPRLLTRIEGRGNGIRTNICNMADIARALKLPPDYPTKFCGAELGAQSKFDPAEGKAIVTGAHEQHDLQSLIDKFIEKFVLCRECQLPEIDLLVRKGRIQYHCNACGDKGDVDNSHKLAAFIIKNPPTVSTVGISLSKKKTKEEKKLSQTLKATRGIEDVEQIAQMDEGDDSTKKKKSSSRKSKGEKTQDKEKTKKSSKASKSVTSESQPDQQLNVEPKSKFEENWSSDLEGTNESDSNEEDGVAQEANNEQNNQSTTLSNEGKPKTTREKTKSKLSKKSSQQSKGNICQDQTTRISTQNEKSEDFNLYSTNTVNSAIEQLWNFISEATKNNVTDNEDTVLTQVTNIDKNTQYILNEKCLSTSSFRNEFTTIQQEYSFHYPIQFYIALKCLFSEKLQGLSATTLGNRIKYLQSVMINKPSNDILIALQDFLYFHNKTSIIAEGYKALPVVLYQFYDFDILTDDAILDFYKGSSFPKDQKRYHYAADEAFQAAKEAAKPMIAWLREDNDAQDEENVDNEDHKSDSAQHVTEEIKRTDN